MSIGWKDAILNLHFVIVYAFGKKVFLNQTVFMDIHKNVVELNKFLLNQQNICLT